jgi:hypothetical protein
MLKIPHRLDNRLTDGGKVVSLKFRPRLLPRNFIFLLLVLKMSKPQGLERLEGFGKLNKFIHLIGS